MHATTCPPESELSAFALGELPPADVDRLASHVTDCADCRVKLESLDHQTDDVVLAIRRGTRGGSRGTAPPAADEPGSWFSSTPATGMPADPLTADFGLPAGAPPAPVEGPGTRIGRYRLVQLLGEGGFGSVFLAEQTEPVRREVALKLVKLGMDTRQVLARFAAERQALAMMDHPNIARVLDAGTTDRGRPYFVMDLVKGVAITEYCDDHGLSTRKRLALFAEVCDAIQHAHTKGVIHRDLKPTNVLVTLRDNQPAPKVIDFGIAKAIGGGRLTDQTLYTEVRQFIGTPEYMSPEQADASMLDVDARTDVYSLGVLLYELLTGTTPHNAKELRARGVDQIGRTIREADPPKPSARVGTLGETVQSVAARRGTDSKRLTQSLKGELDWIVMKCLEKDRTLRYETANALAMDVRRYLKDEPVRAGPPGAGYQVRKFVRRHRGGVAVAGMMAAAVLVGLGLAVQGWVRANRERNNAVAMERREAGERARAEGLIRQLGEAAHARRLAQADAVATAAPAGAIAILDALRGDPSVDRMPIVAAFRQRMASAAPGSVARLRAASALAQLGERPAEELVNGIASAPASEGRLVVGALVATAAQGGAGDVVPPLRAMYAAEPALRTRARYAITLMVLGDDGPAARMLAPAADPTPASALVAEFGQWHGDLARLPEILRRVGPETRGPLCLAASRVDPQAIGAAERDAVVAAMAELYAKDPDGGVHAAAEHALRQWRVDPPPPPGEPRPPAERGWFVNTSGLTMVRVPAGFNVLGGERESPTAMPVLFTRPWYASDREVPHDLFKRFLDDPNVPASDKPPAAAWANARKPRPGLPAVAVNMTLPEAARFCNWLSAREGRKPVYAFPGTRPTDWTLDRAADGYRLMTNVEWEYVARAGASTAFPCCEDGQYLEDHAVLALTAGRPRQPNRWGLFDTAGGVWEYCWDLDLASQPLVPGYDGPMNQVRPIVDPWPTAGGGRGVVFRGGADDSGTFDLRVGSLRSATFEHRGPSKGFRVACAAPAIAPTVKPPANVDDFWVWADEKRPGSPSIGPRAYDRLIQLANEHVLAARFGPAAEFFGRAVRNKPTDMTVWTAVALLRLRTGDVAGHRAACRAMLDLAAAGADPSHCDRAAKVALVDPTLSADDPLFKDAVAQAARAVELGAGSPNIGWFRLCNGLALYRSGRYADAVGDLGFATQNLNVGSAQAVIHLYYAMALHRCGQVDAARESFAHSAGIIPPENPPGMWGAGWIDLLIGQMAMAEAKAVLAGPATAPSP